MQRTYGTTRRWDALKAAFPVTIPVLTGYGCLGMAFGLLLAASGYGPLWALLMSTVIFAGSMQYLTISLLLAPFDPAQAFLLSVMVNARHIFYGLSVLEKYRGLGRVRPFLIAGLTDETFSLTSTLEPPEGVERRDFYGWITLLNYSYWVIASVLGGVLGSVLTINTAGMDFALTALFVVLFLEQWKKRENRPAGVIGLGCTAVSLWVFGADSMVIPAMVMILAVLLGGRKHLCT